VRPGWTDATIASHLVLRDFRIKYSRSVLGWLWSLAQPVTRLIILGFVFTRAIPLDIENYTAFLFVGLVAWQWFATGVMGATTSLVDNRALLLRPGFHRSTVPVVAVLMSVLDAIAGFVVLIAFVSITVGTSWAVLALPGLLLLQFLLISGIGLLLCVANVYVRDVRLLVELSLQLGFYLTPVFYQRDLLPERFQTLFGLNPMAQMLEAMRLVLIDGELPSLALVVRLTVACVGVFIAGALVFQRTSHSVVDEL
jgi:lipopolysaccharide transport system permease protein